MEKQTKKTEESNKVATPKKQTISKSYTIKALKQNIERALEAGILTTEEYTNIRHEYIQALDRYMKEELGL